tara:strand:+ start:2307 stop:3494 length:1188 start_codon:yes stop_codon:yes gene_type:complete
MKKDIIICKKCVMANTRPVSTPEFLKKKFYHESTRFDNDGICFACKYAEYKRRVDWNKREKILKSILNKYRKNDGSYDVIVPGSGGKDSFAVAHKLKYKYSMNPLTVTWSPIVYTDIGKINHEEWIKSGLDNIVVNPNPKIKRILTSLSFKNLCNPFQPFVIGQKNIGPKFAKMYDVKLVMYGESPLEVHPSNLDSFDNFEMPAEHYAFNGRKKDIKLAGLNLNELKKEKVNIQDLFLYMPMNLKDVKRNKIKTLFFSNFENWSPQQNYFYSKKYSNFNSNPFGRSEGTYTKFSSLDDKIDGQYYFTMLIKFGQGRTMNDACRDIRDGYITRDEAIQLIKKYDEEFPKKNFKFFLDYVGLTEKTYWKIIDSFRPKNIWYKNNKKKWINKVKEELI